MAFGTEAQQFASLAGHMPVIFFSLNAKGEFILAEGHGLEALGLKAGELVGMSVFEINFDNDQVHRDVRRALGGETFTSTIEIGETVWSVRFLPLCCPSGLVATVHGVAFDITERCRNEESLLETERSIRKQNEVLVRLAKSTAVIQGDLAQALKEITETAAATLGIERVSIWLYNQDRTIIDCVNLYQRSANKHSFGAQLKFDTCPEYFSALEADRAVVANDACSNEATKGFAENYLIPNGIASLLDAPIRVGGKTVGVVCHEHIGPQRHWTIHEQTFAGSLADLTALAIESQERMISRERLQYRLQFERLLTTLGKNFINLPSSEIDSGIRKALHEIATFVGVDRAYIFILDSDKTKVDSGIEWCNDGIHSTYERMLYLDSELFPWFMKKLAGARPFYIPRVSNLPQDAENERQEMLAQGIKSVLVVPIIYANSVCGFLGFDSVKQEKRWSKEAIQLLQVAAEMFINALERKKAEEQIRAHAAILDITRDAIIVTDNDDCIIFWNKGAEDLYGWKAAEAIGKSTQELLSPGLEETLINQRLDFYTRGEWRGERQQLTKSGQQIVVESRRTVMRNELNEPRSILIVNTDISEKKKWEEQVVRASKLESVGLLAGGIAHDFNNILTAIVGNISISKNALDPTSTINDHLTKAERAVFRAKDLTQQLLTFARGGSPIKTTASLQDLINETVEFACRGGNCRCEIDIPDFLWPVEVDVGQFGQVIQNLVINAVQAMPNGGIISIRCANVELPQDVDGSITVSLTPGKYVRIEVSDQGSGIHPDHLIKIFDPYFTTKDTGTGLGLATTYSIMRKHNGEVTVDSALGQGTTFKLYIPASTKVLAEQIQVETEQTEISLPALCSGRILVMDDEDLVRETTGAMLERLGYEVAYAVDGREAIDSYNTAFRSKQRFDAVIIDLTIPGGLSGKDAICELKKIDPQVVALVSSGYSNDPIMAEYRSYGFSGVVVKPYEIKQLGIALAKVLKSESNIAASNILAADHDDVKRDRTPAN
ncbi:GAF domain-containing protein [bacterium]|nr:GAF domain-containing protein [bacterium]